MYYNSLMKEKSDLNTDVLKVRHLVQCLLGALCHQGRLNYTGIYVIVLAPPIKSASDGR